MPVTATVTAQVAVVQTTTPDGGQARATQTVGLAAIPIANGTTDGRADLAFVDERTVASGANDDLDLAGVLSSVFGQVLTMVEVMTILIEADATNTTVLTVGNGTNPAPLFFGAGTQTATIRAGGCLMAHNPAGWTIAAGTADVVRIANAAGAAAKYRIAILARSV